MTESECQQCGENTFSAAGASSCSSCPENMVSAAGSTSEDDCGKNVTNTISMVSQIVAKHRICPFFNNL